MQAFLWLDEERGPTLWSTGLGNVVIEVGLVTLEVNRVELMLLGLGPIPFVCSGDRVLATSPVSYQAQQLLDRWPRANGLGKHSSGRPATTGTPGLATRS